MKCPFCGHKQGRTLSCPRCGSGSKPFRKGQMLVLRDKLKGASRDSEILGILGSLLLILGVWSIRNRDWPWATVSFSFMVPFYIVGIWRYLQARHLRYILASWGKQKK
jgi:hypothetical protein